jgi:two-component system chemotaxis response regulator CheB
MLMGDDRATAGARRVDRPPQGTARDTTAVLFGGSAGGTDALLAVLGHLPDDLERPLIVAHHLHKTDGGSFAEHLASRVPFPVVEARDKLAIERGRVYVAPADYHLLVERDNTFALSVDPRVNCSRPSVDVLFESAARAWADAVVAVVLSGANEDGARGMKLIRDFGGLCIAQAPDTAESSIMPRSAIELARIEHVLTPHQIGGMLARICSAATEAVPPEQKEMSA